MMVPTINGLARIWNSVADIVSARMYIQRVTNIVYKMIVTRIHTPPMERMSDMVLGFQSYTRLNMKEIMTARMSQTTYIGRLSFFRWLLIYYKEGLLGVNVCGGYAPDLYVILNEDV
ncbi:MAG: hypothetical protein A3C04_00225 [Candidatus Wildermuthbacteria bacterium RIFCSPHIGHO2_02_FULL_45_25]|uniref:Uncharacterized protein n=1 Tax=Candidatus Wildermuthbacteria bacterium RIFCSPHIGHO2_02_FULL_45_25 TaxID=1802450 RepID=A0A1G2R388_9BACT|nr:MAG: hypothetical protein A3C04_00225 [Candidatus Wildermuthbacteria bacterium RIFCSPHIGHO2_02_FULL_45_25]